MKKVSIYIVYETNRVANISKYKYSSNDNYPTLESVLFGAVSLTKNADIGKYKYSGYGIGLIEDQLFHFRVVDQAEM